MTTANKFHLLQGLYRAILNENQNYINEISKDALEFLNTSMDEWTLDGVEIDVIFELLRLSAIYKSITDNNTSINDQVDYNIEKYYRTYFSDFLATHESIESGRLSLAGVINAIYCREFEAKYHITPTVSLHPFCEFLDKLTEISPYSDQDILENIEDGPEVDGLDEDDEHGESIFGTDNIDEAVLNHHVYTVLNRQCFELSVVLNQTLKPFLEVIDKGYDNEIPENLITYFIEYMGDIMSYINDAVDADNYSVHCALILNNSYERMRDQVYRLLAELN